MPITYLYTGPLSGFSLPPDEPGGVPKSVELVPFKPVAFPDPISPEIQVYRDRLIALGWLQAIESVAQMQPEQHWEGQD